MNTILDEVVTSDALGEELNTLNPHLLVVVKVVRNVIVEGVTEEESDDDSEPYVGTRSGAGEILRFSDYKALAKWASEQAKEVGDNSLKLKKNREDDLTTRYAQAYADSLAEEAEAEKKGGKS